MKKTTKFLICLAICFGIGIFCIIVGSALGGHLRNLDFADVVWSESYYVAESVEGVTMTNTDDIQNLDLDISASSIRIQRGDTFSIEGKYITKNQVSDGTWYVEAGRSSRFSKWGLFGKISIPFFRKNSDNSRVTITIPENIVLDETSMDLSASDVKIDSLLCRELELDISAGDISIENLQADEVSLDVSAGDININHYQIEKSASIDCSLGNLTLGRRRDADDNFCNGLEADCSMGNIDVYGKLTGKNYVDCSMGNISLRLAGARENYEIRSTDTTLGEISSRTAKDAVTHDTDNSLYGTLELSCSLGNIDVYYLYQ